MPVPRLATCLVLATLLACACSDPQAAATAPDAVTTDLPPDTAAPDAAPDVPPTPAIDLDHVFPQNRVVDVRLTFAPTVWQTLLQTWQAQKVKAEHPAAFHHDGETLSAIGVRLKGLNSLGIPDSGPIPLGGKYPLKLDFDAFGGPRFHGVGALSLNTNSQDPSLMRERLAYRMYAAFGVPAARTVHARVTVDGVQVGLYTVAQPVDKRFLTAHFGKAGGADDGNLYKCVYNQHGICLLPWLGKDKAAYLRTDCVPGFDECGLVQKTNEADPARNGYGDLVAFLDALHHTPDATFAAGFAQVFEVDAFLRLAAVAFAVSNHDSYFGKGHNYYLYRRPDTGRFQMLPWDLDLTYGMTACEADIGDPTCGQAATHPLVQRVLAVPEFRAKYLGYLQKVVDELLTPQQHAAWAAQMHALVGPLVPQAPNPAQGGAYADQVGPDGRGGELAAFVVARRKDILARLAAGK